jgi:hypothetical protein
MGGRKAIVQILPEPSDGGTFRGTLQDVQFSLDGAALVVSGVLTGTATLADGTRERITQEFTGVTATLSDGLITPQVCDILFLDIGPISLDLLGLEVNLSQIVLDINAVAGPGNLLGNLLCALVGLLD